jgi:hypothetical protein
MSWRRASRSHLQPDPVRVFDLGTPQGSCGNRAIEDRSAGRTAAEASGHFGAESFDNSAIASCTVVMNWAGKMMVEFFSTEISAMVCRVRS